MWEISIFVLQTWHHISDLFGLAKTAI